MIRFEEKNNFLELDLALQEKDDLPSKGAAYIIVKLHSNGYAGQNHLWVSHEALCKFCRNLIVLENKRNGETILESMSPGELNLQIFSIDSLGHMGIRGTTGFQDFEGTDFFPHAVTFGFEFDASQLEKAADVGWVKLYDAESIERDRWMAPTQKRPICPPAVLREKFNPRNINPMPAV